LARCIADRHAAGEGDEVDVRVDEHLVGDRAVAGDDLVHRQARLRTG
jgi:hypothetical protein